MAGASARLAGGSRLGKVADRIAASGATVTPTLFFWDFARTVRHPSPLPRETSLIPEANLAWLRAMHGQQVDPAAAATWDRAMQRVQALVALLLARGVTILPGTDEPWGVLPPGLSLWRELALLAECGMRPLSALRAATSGAAARLRLPDCGRLQSGCAADLVLVAGDPTTVIPGRPEIAAVVHGGKVLRPDDLRAASAAYATGLESAPIGSEFKRVAGR